MNSNLERATASKCRAQFAWEADDKQSDVQSRKL